MINLGQRIRKILKEKSINQKKMAADIDMPTSTLNEVINSHKEPGIYKIYAISEYLDVSMEWLLTGENKKDERRSHYLKNGMGDIIYKTANLDDKSREMINKIIDICISYNK
ncbi:unnamed protein product, partial [marine sediment metagenome]